MKKERKHSGWFWVVVIGGIVFLSLIEKPLSISIMSNANPYDASSALCASVLETIVMIVFAFLTLFIARRVDAHFGYPKNGDAENENNNDKMQKMQERDSDQQ